MTSDYKYYGSSFSNEEWAVSGGIDVAHKSGFYLGSWASTIDFNSNATDPAEIELHFYTGYTNKLVHGLTYDFGVRRYGYPNQNEDANVDEYDYYEFQAKFGYDFDNYLEPALNIGIAVSPDYFGNGGTSVYSNLNLKISLPAKFRGLLSYGYLDVDDINLAYSHYSIGISKEFAGINFDFLWTDAESECGGKDICQGFVFNITKVF